MEKPDFGIKLKSETFTYENFKKEHVQKAEL